jgi:hypothetical protein
MSRNNQPKGVRYGGRQKGTPNKRHELQELLDAVFAKVDPIEKLCSLLNKPLDAGTEARILLRLLEYRYGQPPATVSLVGADAGPVKHTICFGDGKNEH